MNLLFTKTGDAMISDESKIVARNLAVAAFLCVIMLVGYCYLFMHDRGDVATYLSEPKSLLTSFLYNQWVALFAWIGVCLFSGIYSACHEIMVLRQADA